jgi:hypothetical protein
MALAPRLPEESRTLAEQRLHRSRRPLPNDAGQAPGEQVHVRYRVEGRPIAEPSIDWVVHNARTREEVHNIPKPSGFVQQGIALRSAVPYEGVATVFVRTPGDSGCYYITILIRDSAGELARADTVVFRMGQPPGDC